MTKYTIEVDNETWRKFKETVSKNETLNDAIVQLIKEKVS
jgi:macrodomain Ter protein organizer (MatP/YcbG family)